MGIINRLDTFTSNAIAAGEVVERPSSVVKELVENALDADSSAVTVELQNGGISLIRVTDNGCGIAPDDAVVSFERHATSKIANAADLEHISTLGFRGEALASIAAVSQIELKTRLQGAKTGYGVNIAGGEVTFSGEIGCPEGTNLIVRNLFFNTPARVKFLKKPALEGGVAGDFVAKAILCRPDVAFRFINNDKLTYQSAGDGQLISAIYTVYGKELVRTLQKVEYSEGGIEVTGYVSDSNGAKSNRTYQSFFINGRYVRSSLLSSAVQAGFGTRLTVGRFAVCVLHVSLDYASVDVNIHPNKLEVRFGEEQAIFDCVKRATEASLGMSNAVDYSAPELIKNRGVQIKSSMIGELHQAPPAPTPEPYERFESFERPTASPPSTPPWEPDALDTPKRIEAVAPPKREVKAPPLIEMPRYDLEPETPRFEFKESDSGEPLTFDTSSEDVQLLCQLFATYLLVEKGEAMYIIDQHAAHERLLYDRLVEEVQGAGTTSQPLLLPYELALTPNQYAVYETHARELKELGFDFKEKEALLLDMTATPHILGETEAADLFFDALEAFANFKRAAPAALKREKLMQLACKHAVRGNELLDKSQAEALLADFEKLGELNCPHGRPIVIRMKKREIEKLFKRIM